MNIFEILDKKPNMVKERLKDLWFNLTTHYPKCIKKGWWSLKRFFRNIRKYWSILWEDNDFDFGYLENNIYHKLIWMTNYFRTARIVVGSEDTYHQINIALRLAKVAFGESNEEPLPYVNIRNWKRFVKGAFGKQLIERPSSIYILENYRCEKARKIFYEYISMHSQTWSD